jgi:DNA-binding transcriptional MerR regulator
VATKRVHGELLAGDAGELVGVSGTTIGQWARWGYIRASQSDGTPHVYAVEDVAEAAVVADLLARGVRHADIRRAIEELRASDYGDWPLSEARLSVTEDRQLVLHENGTRYALTPRGWQVLAVGPEGAEEVRLRLRRPRRGRGAG